MDKDAPAEVKEFLRKYYISYSGPAGLTEQDDMENWNYAHNASRGAIARRYPYNYQMGMGHEAPPFDTNGLEMPGQIRNVTAAKAAEQNQRGFYSRWAEFLTAKDWDELATWRNGHTNGASFDKLRTSGSGLRTNDDAPVAAGASHDDRRIEASPGCC